MPIVLENYAHSFRQAKPNVLERYTYYPKKIWTLLWQSDAHHMGSVGVYPKSRSKDRFELNGNVL